MSRIDRENVEDVVGALSFALRLALRMGVNIQQVVDMQKLAHEQGRTLTYDEVEEILAGWQSAIDELPDDG